MEIVANVHSNNLVVWAKNRPEVVVFSGDLTASCEITAFRDTYPDRFFTFGMAEQNMMGFAGGMAREGFTPFVHTFGVFMYRRALDQISMSIAFPNLTVRMMGFCPGVTSKDGATHQAIDDIGVLRALPNMTILETGDATDVESVLDVAQNINGPVYVRMLRYGLPRLFSANEPMIFGKARLLSKGTDLVVLSTGICTEEAMRAGILLNQRGISVQHMHVTTLKPFNDTTVIDAIAKSTYGVVTIENHSVFGGLGTAVSEKMAEEGVIKRLIRLGIKDTYIQAGSRPFLSRKYELDAISLIKSVEELIGESLDISEGELNEIKLSTISSKALE